MYPHEPLEDEDDDSWQVSYLDIITIVLGFLIILLSASQIVQPEFTSLSTIFGKSSDTTEYLTTPIDDVLEELTRLLQPQIDQGRLIIFKDLNDIKIRFSGDDFYSSGSATLQGEGKDLLNHVIRAFQQTQYTDFSIDVEGHTDNVPISTPYYPSNWELSTARASNVINYLTQMSLEPYRLKASGYADSRPLVNIDENGYPFAATKEQNRRIVLRVYYDSEGLQRRAEEAALAQATADSISITPLLSNNETTEQLAQSKTDQIIEQLNKIAEANTSLEENTNSKANEEEPLDLATEVKPEKPIISDTIELATLPSFTDPNVVCNFSIQIGNYRTLSSGFQEADKAESASGVSFELASNNENYSVRSTPTSSFIEAVSTLDKTQSSLNKPDIGIIHQCSNNTIITPNSMEYQIQFGAFQNQENALNFTVDLVDEFGIQTYMTRSSSTFTIVAGPYNDRETVLSVLNAFREKGVQQNIFIKPVSESIKEFTFGYQIQLNSYNSMQEAEVAAQQIQQSLGISSTATDLGNSTYVLLSSKSNNFSLMSANLKKLSESALNLKPILFYLEYIQ